MGGPPGARRRRPAAGRACRPWLRARGGAGRAPGHGLPPSRDDAASHRTARGGAG
ncbi:MAG: septum formation initiator family protein, partial [Chloroflexi bacterium]